jgi:hypothetical protein
MLVLVIFSLVLFVGSLLAIPLEWSSLTQRAAMSGFLMAAGALMAAIGLAPTFGGAGGIAFAGVVLWGATYAALFAPTASYLALRIFPRRIEASAAALLQSWNALVTLFFVALEPCSTTLLSGGSGRPHRSAHTVLLGIFAGTGVVASAVCAMWIGFFKSRRRF